MPKIKNIGRVLVPVADQDAAIKFYTDKLGFALTADVPFGDEDRWVEVSPPQGDAVIALVPPQGQFEAGRPTGISLGSSDPKADYDEMKEMGIDVDDELMGGAGGVPLLFFFRDNNKNQLMVVQA
jgi:lactoylglutathione lyase